MKILLPISSLCAVILIAAAMFTSCQKETQLVPAMATDHAADDTVTDRTPPPPPEMLYFSYTVGNAVDLQYRVTNANGSSIFYTKYFYNASGSTSSNVPGLYDHPRIQIRGRRQYNGAGTENVSWVFTRTTCDPMTGTTAVTAPSSTAWSSIPWVTIQEAAGPCN